jgi:AraC-like DNA-binding protein
MSYTGISNQKDITIEKIFSVHYFEYASNFSFEGESHDFWEFIYVDKGVVELTAGNEVIHLHANEIFFHEPNEFHTVNIGDKIAPNAVIVSFSCQDEIMNQLSHKILTIGQQERDLLGKIISEAKHCFDCRLDDPYLKTIPLKESTLIGTRQSLFLYLEQFLILMLRKHCSPDVQTTPIYLQTGKSTKQANDAQLFGEIVKYIQKNIYNNIDINSLCEIFSISRSRLQKLFKRCCNLGIIEYASYLKIEQAKEMIRSKNSNFTQIAEELGYSSVHYFSRQFKKVSGMTPSEYASSVKMISEKTFS